MRQGRVVNIRFCSGGMSKSGGARCVHDWDAAADGGACKLRVLAHPVLHEPELAAAATDSSRSHTTLIVACHTRGSVIQRSLPAHSGHGSR
jgi:hypothetical protein